MNRPEVGRILAIQVEQVSVFRFSERRSVAVFRRFDHD